MNNEQIYVFVTCHKTILFFSETGKFFHAEDGFEPNIFCDSDGEIIDNSAFSKKLSNFIVTKHLGFGTYSLFFDGYYLSAQPDGVITERTECHGWEIFSLLPLKTFLDQKYNCINNFQSLQQSNQISKNIHQTFSSARPPEAVKENIEKLKSMNPDWTYNYWSDKDLHDFIYHYYGWDILKLYLRINPRYGACRADLFRYLCLYQLGGVYLDIKSGSDISLNNIVKTDDQYLLSQWQNDPGQKFFNFGTHAELDFIPGGEFQQWHIIAAAGHPFLEQVIKTVLRNISEYSEHTHGIGVLQVLRLTGPIVYTKTIHSMLSYHKHRFFDAEAEGLRFIATSKPSGGAKHYSTQITPIVL